MFGLFLYFFLLWWYHCNCGIDNKEMFNLCVFNFTEKIWYVSSWWIWFGIGAIPDLDSGSAPHPRCLSVPSLCPALQTIAILVINSWEIKELMLGNEWDTLLNLSENKTFGTLLFIHSLNWRVKSKIKKFSFFEVKCYELTGRRPRKKKC